MRDYSNISRRQTPTLSKLVLLFLLVTVSLLGVFVLYVYFKVNTPVSKTSEAVPFRIEAGESFTGITRSLADQGIIDSSFAVRVYALIKNLDTQIKSGEFLLDKGSTPKEIIYQLTEGKGLAEEVKLTFREGGTLFDYAEVLESRDVLEAKILIDYKITEALVAEHPFLTSDSVGKSLEGFLFPDTYIFGKESSLNDVLDKFLSNFENKITAQLSEDISKSEYSLFDIVTLASIIEGEVGRNTEKISDDDIVKMQQERRLVSGVFHNRLRDNHALQSDATLSYITGVKKARASYADTKIDNPYNTYQVTGLPPGPIGNPSLDSIMAAMYPQDTDYYYFLSKPSGEAVFSKTLDEHNRNKSLYLQ